MSAQAPQGHGIGGFWSMAPGPTPPRRAATPAETELIAQFRAGAVLLADAGATEFPPGDYGGLAVHASLREAAKSYDPENQTDVSLTCRPPGVIYSMQGPFPIEIFEGRDLVVIKLEYFDLVRIVFMNETEHPDDWPHSQTGHSIGRWEGNTLVVDTAKLMAGTLFNNGVDYTEDVHLLERFRLADENTLDRHAAVRGRRLVRGHGRANHVVSARRRSRLPVRLRPDVRSRHRFARRPDRE